MLLGFRASFSIASAAARYLIIIRTRIVVPILISKNIKLALYISPSVGLTTFIPRWKHRFSSDHRSQATSGAVSTRMGDHQRIPRAVGLTIKISQSVNLPVTFLVNDTSVKLHYFTVKIFILYLDQTNIIKNTLIKLQNIKINFIR